jgi:hypothetical protein
MFRNGILGPIVLAALAVSIAFVAAKETPEWNNGLPQQHKSKWKVHDFYRPQPQVVTPGAAPGAPPSDAIVLFDGKDLSAWESVQGGPARWKVENGYVEVNSTGSIRTKQPFGDCQLHLEWMAPTPPQKDSQARGNSGIFFMNRYEVQVLDSFDNWTYADGHAAGVYGQHPPMANACRKPGEWQTYDIVFRAPRFNGKELVEPGRLTVLHNGVLTAHHAEIYGSTVWRQAAKYQAHGPEDVIQIQDHGDKQAVRFRNIWVRKLDLSTEKPD